MPNETLQKIDELDLYRFLYLVEYRRRLEAEITLYQKQLSQSQVQLLTVKQSADVLSQELSQKYQLNKDDFFDQQGHIVRSTEPV